MDVRVFYFHKMRGISWLVKELLVLDSQGGWVRFMEWVSEWVSE
jgi:hypothetical protein